MPTVDVTLINNALGLCVALLIPVLVAILVAAALAGILRVATQIDDAAVSFVSKLVGAGVALSLGAAYFSTEIVAFTTRLWGGADFYY